jgi:hypothetical protein
MMAHRGQAAQIGIRPALGADARRVLGSVFARASAQVSAVMMTTA